MVQTQQADPESITVYRMKTYSIVYSDKFQQKMKKKKLKKIDEKVMKKKIYLI